MKFREMCIDSVERLKLTPGEPITVRELVDSTCPVGCSNDCVALSPCMDDSPDGRPGWWAAQGATRFGKLRVFMG